MSRSKFSIRKGAQVPKARANQIGVELGKIRRQRGKLTAEIVVEAVAAKQHPLHDLFEWDNAAAAHAHRLDRARYLMRTVYVLEETLHPEPIRTFVAIAQDDEMADYTPVADILSNPKLRRQLIADFAAELQSWLERTAHLPELKASSTLVRQAVGHATGPRKRRKKAG